MSSSGDGEGEGEEREGNASSPLEVDLPRPEKEEKVSYGLQEWAERKTHAIVVCSFGHRRRLV